ncbi:proton pump-interactor 1-like protein [Tanacetum coccineum]|uniref:Proton pump-interactor 1-like protein n=1 Tax=Tanacetum coccineum TaxID=301880 RepID=A0ABQ4Y6T1_9ASTR
MTMKNTKRLDSYNIKCRTSPRVVKRDIAEKLYQALRFSYSTISQELDKCKKDEIRINNEIMCFSTSEKRGEWKKQNIKHLEEALGGLKHKIRMSSIPRTGTGFLDLTNTCREPSKKSGETTIYVGTDKKRCHNRLTKGRMDFDYCKQVQEELLSSMKSYNERPLFDYYGQKEPNYVVHGARELNHVMESLIHRIQHGNNNRAEEAKLHHEIRNLKDTIEIYTAPVPAADNRYERYSCWSMRVFSDKQYKQIVLNQLAKARTVKRTQLNLELDLSRKNIRCMERVLEQISSRMMKAYKGAYKLGEQQNEVKSSYTEYKSLMTYVKELARREDIEELMQVYDRLF